ncbi:hypothetical protein [Nevskia soli]|nr:hypothetical protein [Nevskia soli]
MRSGRDDTSSLVSFGRLNAAVPLVLVGWKLVPGDPAIVDFAMLPNKS